MIEIKKEYGYIDLYGEVDWDDIDKNVDAYARRAK